MNADHAAVAAPDDGVRRSLLAQSDELLDAIERLRLAERRTVPAELASAVALLQARLGRPSPVVAPATVASAQNLVFALQQRLMARNPRTTTPRAHEGRAAGQAAFAFRGGTRWKFLMLPPPPPSGPDDGWIETVGATVERALDRWCYAQHHAVQAARSRRGIGPALGRAAAAWSNYWDLVSEAARVIGNVPRPPPTPRR